MPTRPPKRFVREAMAAKADVEARLERLSPVATEKGLPGLPWGIRVSRADGSTAFLAYGYSVNRAWLNAKQLLDKYGAENILDRAGFRS